jgi:hypothetical protein
MLNLALWLKKNNFHLDQVQTFTPTPMAMATTMYHSGKNPLHKVTEDSEVVETAKSGKTRKLHKAFLRYYDPENWPVLREGLRRMGRGDLIGNGERHLVPAQGGEEAALQQQRGDRRPAPTAPMGPRSDAAPKGRVIEVAPKRAAVRGAERGLERGLERGRANARSERVPAGTPFMAPPSKVKPSILSTIKAKPRAGRK